MINQQDGIILVRVCAAISAGLCLKAYCVGSRCKFFNAYFEAIEAGLIPNYGEFAIIKIGIIYFFPNTDVFKCVAVTQPIGYEEISVFGTYHIRQADIVLAVDFYYIDFGGLYGNFCHFLLFGGVEAGEKVVVEGGFLFDVVEDHAHEGVALEFAAHLLEVAPAVAFGGGIEAEADV